MAHRPQARRTLAPQPPPPDIYRSKYDLELAALICRRVAAGESLRAICRADPAMPTGKTVWKWRRAHPEFDEMLSHAQGVARERALSEQAARDRARRDDPGRRRAWNAGLSGYCEALADRILDRVAMGESLTGICRDLGSPSIGTVYNWLRAEPEFVEAYRIAREIQAEAIVERACETAPPPEAGMRALRSHQKAAERRLGFVKLRRYAPPEGPRKLEVLLQDGEGPIRVIYAARRD
jgi:hypothetical protein